MRENRAYINTFPVEWTFTILTVDKNRKKGLRVSPFVWPLHHMRVHFM